MPTLQALRGRDSVRTSADRLADAEGVACGALRAAADGDVVRDGADGSHAAGAGAGVAALVADAGAVHRAVGADEALGPANLVRVAVVLGLALADAVAIEHAAARVRAAGVRIAWVGCDGRQDGLRCNGGRGCRERAGDSDSHQPAGELISKNQINQILR